MAALHEALECLAPTPWENIPQSPAEQREYITDISQKARLIVDSIPELPVSETENSSSAVESTAPSAQMKPSSARAGNNTDPEIESLQQNWGKAIKVGSAKDNPFSIPVYKLPGNDGKGAWFARRSVHEGLSFSRWKEKISSEMGETLKANQECIEKGRIPDKAVRGIGAEKEVESIEVKDKEGKNVLGTIKVYKVSARFPRPTTSRDFVPLIINWEGNVAGLEGEGGRRGRSWIMVSKPCQHPDVPPTDAYIRGQYESVEMIREIPKKGGEGSSLSSKDDSSESKRSEKEKKEEKKKKDKKDKKDKKKDKEQAEKSEETERASEDDDSNPVEWIMVTRSDPGGTIPRWMVEKGTPKSICTDTVKFLDWACQNVSLSDPPESEPQETQQEKSPQDDDDSDASSDYDSAAEEVEHHGLIASFAYLLNAGLERYAPQAVLDYMPHGAPHELGDEKSIDGTPSEKPKADAISLVSGDKGSLLSGNSLASPNLENAPAISPTELMQKDKKGGKLTSHEKDLVKLAERKRDIETKLESVRSEIASLNLTSPEDIKKEKLGNSGSEQPNSSTSSLTKASEAAQSQSPAPGHKRTKTSESAQMHKAASGMFNNESKLLKDLGKVERDQLKIASKIEARLQKEAKREEKSRSRSKTDEMRREIDELKKEIDRLRSERRQWLDLVKSLEAENTRLAAKAGEKS